MKLVVGGRSGFGEAGLEVVRQLKRIFIIPLTILVISDEIKNYYMNLKRMAFNVRKSFV
jgi:hypothetical protein